MNTQESQDMSATNERLTTAALVAVWDSYPCGIAAIGKIPPFVNMETMLRILFQTAKFTFYQARRI